MDKIFKLLLSAALLLCCIMLNAQQPKGEGSQAKTPLSIDNVAYIDADGVEQTVTATVITDETGTLTAGWYAVTGSDVQTGTSPATGPSTSSLPTARNSRRQEVIIKPVSTCQTGSTR